MFALIAILSLFSKSAFAQFDLGKIVKSGAAAMSKAGSAANMVSNLTSVFSNKKVASLNDVVGSWTYVEPAVVFSSENILKSAGGKVASASIEKTLQNQLNKVGITRGKVKMTFSKDGKFTQSFAGKTVSGTFSINGKSVVLKYGGKIQQVVGTTQMNGNDLLIVMDGTKLLGFVKTIGNLTGNAILKSASSLLGSMDGMLCGLRLQKTK